MQTFIVLIFRAANCQSELPIVGKIKLLNLNLCTAFTCNVIDWNKSMILETRLMCIFRTVAPGWCLSASGGTIKLNHDSTTDPLTDSRHLLVWSRSPRRSALTFCCCSYHPDHRSNWMEAWDKTLEQKFLTTKAPLASVLDVPLCWFLIMQSKKPKKYLACWNATIAACGAPVLSTVDHRPAGQIITTIEVICGAGRETNISLSPVGLLSVVEAAC